MEYIKQCPPSRSLIPPMKKTHKAHFAAINKAGEPPGSFDAAMRAIVSAPKAAVAASMAREKASKQVRAIAKGRH